MVTRIWISTRWRNIKPTDTVNSTRAVRSFCISNCIPNNLFKSQGGWYKLEKDGTLTFVTPALNSITFEQLYEKLCGT